MKKKLKRCLNCKFATIQIIDDGTDLDFDKSLVCINDNTKEKTNTFIVDINDTNKEVLGFEVDMNYSCSYFKSNKQRIDDIRNGC